MLLYGPVGSKFWPGSIQVLLKFMNTADFPYSLLMSTEGSAYSYSRVRRGQTIQGVFKLFRKRLGH